MTAQRKRRGRDQESACECGHVNDEHGGDPAYPGAMACNVDDCECVAFDPGEPRAALKGAKT